MSDVGTVKVCFKIHRLNLCWKLDGRIPCRSMNGVVSQQTGYGGQPYMQQPTAQYVDIDGAYANASNSGFPPPSPHRPDYRQQPH
jgi:hypothetical protein